MFLINGLLDMKIRYRAFMTSKNKSLKEKWISDAAYYKSLERDAKTGLESQNWREVEQEFERLMKARVKSGLVSL